MDIAIFGACCSAVSYILYRNVSSAVRVDQRIRRRIPGLKADDRKAPGLERLLRVTYAVFVVVGLVFVGVGLWDVFVSDILVPAD